MSLSITTITESGSLTGNSDIFFFNASSNDITFTMGDITGDGVSYIFKRIDASDEHIVTLQGFNSNQTIDGQVSLLFSPNRSFRIISYNGSWTLLY